MDLKLVAGAKEIERSEVDMPSLVLDIPQQNSSIFFFFNKDQS